MAIMLFQGHQHDDPTLLLTPADDAAPALRWSPQIIYAGVVSLSLPALRIQAVRFCVVGLLGTFVNLAVYAALIGAAAALPVFAAVVAFCAAATHNHLLHRVWTFDRRDAAYLPQGARFLVVSLVALAVNILILRGLLAYGAGHMEAQALAIAAATPVSFAGNRVWAFASTT